MLAWDVTILQNPMQVLTHPHTSCIHYPLPLLCPPALYIRSYTPPPPAGPHVVRGPRRPAWASSSFIIRIIIITIIIIIILILTGISRIIIIIVIIVIIVIVVIVINIILIVIAIYVIVSLSTLDSLEPPSA